MIDAGYFAKRVQRKPAYLNAAGVREICSVSECISPGAPNWFSLWLHNDFGWFNRIADALRPVPAGDKASYRLFAYRVYPELFRSGQRVQLVIPGNVQPEPIPSDFETLGFDSASKSTVFGLSLECSPLSCNAMAAEIGVNEFCLFPDLASALAGGERFAAEQPEPGDYYVIEVLERGGNDGAVGKALRVC